MAFDSQVRCDIETIDVTINNYERMANAPEAWARIKKLVEEKLKSPNKPMPKLPSLEECIWQAVDANKGAHAYDHDTSTVKKVYKFIAGKIGR